MFTEEDAVEGRFSPEPIARGDLPVTNEVLVVEAEDDVKQLQREREMVRHREMEALTCKLMNEKHGVSSIEHVTPMSYDNEMECVCGGEVTNRHAPLRSELQEGETEFKDAIQLPHQVFAWQQKYIPQKPIYFNKVKSGYDWNQYNQTHYDLKNPPPKVIQGYSFNIFYPDLVDKSKQPSFVLEPDKADPNWCVIRFHAGAPYEDVAFRVRSW